MGERFELAPQETGPARYVTAKVVADKAVEMWNEMAERAELPKVQRLTDSRVKKVVLRIREVGGMPGWQEALNKIEASKFLTGHNDRGWRANFDFMLQQSSFTKLMEGSYDNRESRGDTGGRKTTSLDRSRQFVANLAEVVNER